MPPIISVKILNNQNYEYSIDSFPDYPITRIRDNKKGFLGRILKSATIHYKELKKISVEIFLKIDEKFQTLKPERNCKGILKRRIHCLSSKNDELLIVYDYKSNQIQIETSSSANTSTIVNVNEIFSELKNIFESINSNQQNECGICYSSYLDGQLAIFPCQSCDQIYHETCLREWYNSNPECKSVFDKIIGKCLFCDEVKVNGDGGIIIIK